MHLFLPINDSPRGKELVEFSDRQDILFLRDYYPMLSNGAMILLDNNEAANSCNSNKSVHSLPIMCDNGVVYN